MCILKELRDILSDYSIDIFTYCNVTYIIYKENDLRFSTKRRHIKIISSMGAGAKKDITKIAYADINDTYNCGLSKAIRLRLRKAGVKGKLPVVFSSEQADKNAMLPVNEPNKKSTTGTISYMPATFGCYLAAYVLENI